MPRLFSVYTLCIMLGLYIDHSESCSDGEFQDKGKGCKRCPAQCLFCDSDDYCLSCENEYWGATCEKQCSNCKYGTSCEKTNGFCLDGCSDGLTGVLCDTRCDEKCLSCNRTNSKHCLTCTHNRFTVALFCDNICPSSCSNETCNDDTGFCTFGCKVGFWGTKCERECPDYCVNKFCLRENGTCINSSLEEGPVPSYVIYVTVIVTVIGLIVVAITGCVICHRRQKRRTQNSSGSSKSDFQETGPNIAPTKLTETSEGRLYISTNNKSYSKIKSKNLLQVAYDKSKEILNEDASSSRPTNLHTRDKSTKGINHVHVAKPKARYPVTKNVLEQVILTTDRTLVKSLVDKFKTHQADQEQSKSRQQGFEDIAGRLKTKNEAEIRQEFSSLPTGDSNRFCVESQQLDNRKKLEQMDICPFESNKVVVIGHNKKRHYMNASKIKDNRNKEVAFIACIAPNYEYYGWDFLFWRMVWLQRCSVIVMLNKLEENNTEFPQYWPNKHAREMYANLAVTCIEENAKDTLGYVSRKFKIEGENTEPVVVKQLQYLGWSEGEAAESVSNLLEFRNIVNEAKQTNSSPIVVHSRKGVGRTGTYIALDILLQTVDGLDDSLDESAVDIIYSCVKHLRKQRVRMVDTEEQYIFLYRALIYYLDRKAENERGNNAYKLPTNT